MTIPTERKGHLWIIRTTIYVSWVNSIGLGEDAFIDCEGYGWAWDT